MSHQFFNQEGLEYFQQGHYATASDCFQKSLQQQPANPIYHYHYAKTLLALGHLDLAQHHLQQSKALDPTLNIASEWNQSSQRLAKRQTMPSICLNSIHRSGTLYIHRTLSQLLDLEPVHISASVPVENNVIIFSLAERLAQGGAVSQDHFLPTPLNLWTLEQHFDRLIVHIRDPRQAMLSSAIQYQHYQNKHSQSLKYDKYQHIIHPNLPSIQDFSAYLDYLVKYQFSGWVTYIDQWYQASQTSQLKILLTQHQDLKDTPQHFFQNILTFYNLPSQELTLTRPSNQDSISSSTPNLSSPNLHFRQGSNQEWQRVFTPAQKDHLRQQMPPYFFKQFNWPN